MELNIITIVFASLYLAHHGFEAFLDILQMRHLKNRKDRVPKHLEGKVDIDTIRKAVAYNLSKLKLGMVSRISSLVAIVFMIAFGFQYADELVRDFNLNPIVTGLCFFAVLSAVGFIWDLPLELVSTFGVETKHGFNKQTPGSYVLDLLKGLVVNSILGGLMLTVVLWLIGSGGKWWWLIAFVVVSIIQLLLMWLYPVLIMPLFNKFTPVEEELSEAVSSMAQKVKFPLKGVVSMDGSKRSTHSNAFIIGLKGARRIVLYDTLISKVGQSELVAVLAHELGHFKLGHLRNRMILVFAAMAATFFGIDLMQSQEIFFKGLGFSQVSDYALLVVFGLAISELLPPAGWFMRYLSRKDEYAADKFAIKATKNTQDLSNALVALTKQNLSSPGSHKLYRSYYNSHPGLKARLAAIKKEAT